MPRISVITPLFNKGPYIGATIASVQAQTLRDWEMLVVDNGSTDEGAAIVQGISDPRVRYLSIEERGPGVARNRGIALAQGEWLHFLDADDLIEPSYLQEQVQLSEQNSHADVVVSRWTDFLDSNPSARTIRQPTAMGEPNYAETVRANAIAFTPWAVHAAIVRRSAISEELRWPEQLDGFLSEDTAFWFRLITLADFVYSPAEGALYRFMTPGCRTRLDDPEKWFNGNHAAVTTNLNFLAKTGRVVTDAQCESLVRLYSDMYVKARQQRNRAVAGLALQQANRWLAERRRRGIQMPASMRLRSLLGIQNFQFAQQFWHTLRGTSRTELT